MDDVFFINQDCKKLSSEDIASHIGLANLILENNEQLKKEFQKSGRNNPVDFLICDKGYLKITNQGIYQKLVYSSDKLSPRQKELVEYYTQAEGYDSDDLAIINGAKGDIYK